MIDLHYWPTPNGHKITIFLEEAGLEYDIHPVDISAGDQFKASFLAISPNNRMPAIVDHDPSIQASQDATGARKAEVVWFGPAELNLVHVALASFRFFSDRPTKSRTSLLGPLPLPTCSSRALIVSADLLSCLSVASGFHKTAC